MWPLEIDCLGEYEHCSEGFNTHLWCVQGHRWENIYFSTKPRHVSLQIDHLEKTSPVLRLSTHIYGVSQEIDGKTFIFRVNLCMSPFKLIVLGKRALVLRFSTHIFLDFQKIDWKMFIFRVNIGMWPLKSIVWEKRVLFWGFQHTFMVLPRT